MEIFKNLQNRLRQQHRTRSVIHLATHGRARIVAALSAPTLTTLRNRVAVLSRSKADFFGAGAMGKTQIVRHGCKLDWIGWNNMIAFWSYGSTSITVCVYVGYISIRGTECFPHCPPHPPMIQNSLTLVWKCYSSFNSHVSSFIGPIWNKGLWQVFYRKETLL